MPVDKFNLKTQKIEQSGHVCKDCGKEMLGSDTCTLPLLFAIDSGLDMLVVYERDATHFDVSERCHDCGILNKPGNIHHWGCDIEHCPKCGGQLISCRCFEGKEMYPTAEGTIVEKTMHRFVIYARKDKSCVIYS